MSIIAIAGICGLVSTSGQNTIVDLTGVDLRPFRVGDHGRAGRFGRRNGAVVERRRRIGG